MEDIIKIEDDIEFDYSKLRGKIREVYETEEAFAKALDISSVTLSKLFNNKSKWTHPLINKSCDLLGIDYNYIYVYFFTKKVK